MHFQAVKPQWTDRATRRPVPSDLLQHWCEIVGIREYLRKLGARALDRDEFPKRLQTQLQAHMEYYRERDAYLTHVWRQRYGR